MGSYIIYKFMKIRSSCVTERFFGYFCLIDVLLASLLPGGAYAASIATAGQDDGYSSRILDKIVSRWKPPKQLIGTHRLKLILSVDSDGQLLDCKVQKTSGIDAFDASACAAARSASPFGSPPYGMPATVHFSFWTDGLNSRVPIQDEKGQINTFYPDRAGENARIANERAQAKAQAAAKKTGRQLPGAQSPLETGKKGGVTGKHESENDEKMLTASQAETSDKKTNIESSSDGAGIIENSSFYKTRAKYISKITWDLRNSMYVPVQTKPGVYHATVRIECDKMGNIISSNLIKGSGDSLLNKYVMQGIERAGKVLPPPTEFGHTFDLTFKIVRQGAKKKSPSARSQPVDNSSAASESNP